jgi:hypothetical protein
VDDRYEPVNIDVERDKSVTLAYVDGYVVGFDLVMLRQGCPCATCRGLRDQGEDVWPRPDSPTPLRIEDARLHGAWDWRSLGTTATPQASSRSSSCGGGTKAGAPATRSVDSE